MDMTLDQQYNVGEKPTVILYAYIIAMQGHQKNSKNKRETICFCCCVLHINRSGLDDTQ